MAQSAAHRRRSILGGGAVKGERLSSTRDLLPSENRLITAMQQLRFGRFEFLQINNGEVALDPWPATIHGVKFGSEDATTARIPPDDFQLKRQVIELLEYVRAVNTGEIRCLEFRHGLPFTMEIGHRPGANEGRRG
jgi:hypothetical protein